MNRTENFNERAEFCARLRTALESAPYARRAGDVARYFNLRAGGSAVTMHAVRKWMLGEAIPTQERIKVLAAWLHVSPAWLRFGDAGRNFLTADRLVDYLDDPANRMLLDEMHILSNADQILVHAPIEHLLTCQDMMKKRRANEADGP